MHKPFCFRLRVINHRTKTDIVVPEKYTIRSQARIAAKELMKKDIDVRVKVVMGAI